MDGDIPVHACAWVHPSTLATSGLGTARGNSTGMTPADEDVATHGFFLGETVGLIDVVMGDGAWIRSLTE